MPMERMSMRHAPMSEIEERGNLDVRDRAGRSCVVDGSVDATTLRRGSPAVECRFDRRRAGAAAFRQCRRQARPPASCGARLGRPLARCGASTSPCRSFGRNISPPILAVIATCELDRVESANLRRKDINHANRIILANPRSIPSTKRFIRSLRIAQESYRENHIDPRVFTRPGSEAEIQTDGVYGPLTAFTCQDGVRSHP